MKVTINHVDKNVGTIFKKNAPAIDVTVEFTDTEKALLTRSGIDNQIFYTAPVHRHYTERMQHINYTAAEVQKEGLYVVFDDDITRRGEDVKIREALKHLKDVIDVAGTPIKTSDSFEL